MLRMLRKLSELSEPNETLAMEVDSDFGSKSDSKSQLKFNLRWNFFFCIIFILNSIKSINVIHIIFTVAMTLMIVTVL